MTTEITLLSQSHLPSIYFCLFILHFCSSAFPPPPFANLLFSHSILSSSCSPCSLASLQYSSRSSLSQCLLLVFACSFLLYAFPRSFSLSISSAASVDHLSECQMATSATVGIKNSFLVGTTEREARGVKWGERGVLREAASAARGGG